MLLLYAIPRKSQALHKKFTSLLLSFCKFLIYVLVTVHQLQRRGQHIVICCGLHGIRLVEITLHSSLSFFMPNSLRSKPLRHLGLLRTTTCIEPTTFRRLIRHYRRSAPGIVPVQLRIGPSGTVSTTTSAPFWVEMVMQSEPSAYSLLTPRGLACGEDGVGQLVEGAPLPRPPLLCPPSGRPRGRNTHYLG